MEFLKKEVKRLWILIAIVIVALIQDPLYKVVLFNTAIFIGSLLVAHLVRKILTPYWDWEILYREAVDDNSLPAALVLGFSVLFTAFNIFIIMSLMKA